MKKNNTQELFNELKTCKSIEQYINDHEADLTEISVRDTLLELLIKYETEKNVVISRSHIAESYAYQIFDGRRNPSRDKLISLALAFPLTIEDANRLLRAGKFSELYVRNKRDSLIIFCLAQKSDIFKTNELLEQYGETLLS